MIDPKPTIATNREGELVADALNSRLSFWRTEMVNAPEVAIATGYFNVGGFMLLAQELEQVRGVRLLIGAAPQPPEQKLRRLAEPTDASRAERRQLENALSQVDEWIRHERDLLGFSLEADRSNRRLIDWLESGNVEVRRLRDRFLHGEAFLITTGSDSVMVGSSNFTFAGLNRNLELNLARYDPDAVNRVTSWFEDLWERAEEYDLAAVYQDRFEEHAPWTVYLRMLCGAYGRDLEDDEESPSEGLTLAPFQMAGVVRALRCLDERSGVLVADDVGLGKTFIAGEILL